MSCARLKNYLSLLTPATIRSGSYWHIDLLTAEFGGSVERIMV